jgi:hypothetical protein
VSAELRENEERRMDSGEKPMLTKSFFSEKR